MGRLGTCLARALHRGLPDSLVVASRSPEPPQRLAAELGSRVEAIPVRDVCARAQLLFLTVPDGEIAGLCEQLAVGPAHAVVHCSGSLARAPLECAAARGAATGVFHPLQAFIDASAGNLFAGIHIGVEADEPLAAELAAIASALGSVSFSLSGVDRARYHAAAVFASNYLVALFAAAARIWQQAGLPSEHARAALLPLSRGALSAIADHDLVAALTGPVRRGDIDTVRRHVEALAGDPDSQQLYRALAAELVRLPLALPEDLQRRLAELIAGRS